MATNKQELGDAISAILDVPQDKVDTPEKAQALKVQFSQNLASEIDIFVKNQISASFISFQTQIDALGARVTALEISLSGSSGLVGS